MFHKESCGSKCGNGAGIALAIGALLGLATGLFLRSEKAEELSIDAQRLAHRAKRQLARKMDTAERMTREAYEDFVEDFLARYRDNKALAEDQYERVHRYLLDQWTEIRERMESEKE
ncbi:hypothetical protein KBB27_01400 [Patescibacteria group bacterium]|nr:hypothetical protein [Patescibacteria group bacterium]